ncbi:MAG: 16S rRNA (cytosine(1402)-N(4))-methyltransferase [Bacteroidetes bacterium CG2_30_33_31]|nr:MAG: 16S rRNA (cytosine(1402)-N(4))-methyltransferase [Bacteroidetes bacterium CG2_30_33_31]
MAYHLPVLAEESVKGLNINPEGIYVDATFGGGGHSKLILSELNTGKLVGFDRDSDAEKNVLQDDRFVFIPQNYRFIENFLDYNNLIPVDGILADLGVSSHQFDIPERGFSFRFDGPLDLRMDFNNGKTAADIINTYEEKALIHIFSLYGEIKNSRTLARQIIKIRDKKKIDTTYEFVEAIDCIVSIKTRNKYLAQVFQALRIEVNEELDSLKDFLIQSSKVLKTGGRLVVISYHSLEDRLVKNFLRSGNFDGKLDKDFYGNINSPFTIITRKPMVADDDEIEINGRARSAKLRIAEKN